MARHFLKLAGEHLERRIVRAGDLVENFLYPIHELVLSARQPLSLLFVGVARSLTGLFVVSS